MTKLIMYFSGLNKILDDVEIKEILDSYNSWIDRQYSIIDGDYNVSRPHHVRVAGYCGMGQKPADIFKVGITYEQHTEHHTKGKYQDIFIEKLPEIHDEFLEEHPIILEKINNLTGISQKNKVGK